MAASWAQLQRPCTRYALILCASRSGLLFPACCCGAHSHTHQVYNDSYRSECSHRKANGQIVDSPEWKLSSVRRHLLFTTNEAGSSVVFDDYVTQTLQVSWPAQMRQSALTSLRKHMIIHQNKVVRPSTGEVDEDGRKSLCNSIETLMKWRSHVRDTRCGKKTSRK